MNAQVEKAFSDTTRLLLGEALSPIDEYGEWLKRNVGETVSLECSGRQVKILRQYRYERLIPREKIVLFEEAREKGAHLKIRNPGENTSLGEILGEVPGIAYLNIDDRVGKNANNVETIGLEDTVNTYRTTGAFNSKNISYCFHTKYSESIFGSFRAIHSRYCINCYNCVGLTSSFECDSVKDSSRAYFSHNCENVHDAMFCSNAKGLRYAVGNVVVGREKYEELRGMLLDYVLGELKEKKSLGLDIFNLGRK